MVVWSGIFVKMNAFIA